jgi:RNA polymerase sigma-70 factor, ECF subfamily
VQETFLGALRSLHQVDPTRPFGAWLHGICRNHLYRFLQRRMKGRSRQQALVDQAMAESLAETDDEDSARRMLALRHCLEGMEAGQRELLDQRYRDQIPVQDLASQLNTTPGSISMRLLRLKAALARCIRSRLESNR